MGKRYKLGETLNFSRTIREAIVEFPRKFMSEAKRKAFEIRERKNNPDYDPETPPGTFWALRHLNLEINHSDVVGIIGSNGSGKSTLLKVLSKITIPTTGHAKVYGRVGSLLEVGTGFHPDLTGRENIFLNGSIMGMSKADIKMRFDEIVAFSEVEKFLDTPIKRYSSGMTVRLAFAVAAHLEPEILIVDEVLAVGDAAFQNKCMGKMKDVSSEGRTVLFVSHNMSAVRSLCSRGILLKNGKIVVDTTINEAISHYNDTLDEKANDAQLLWKEGEMPGDDYVQLIEAQLLSETGVNKTIFDTDEQIKIRLKYKSLKNNKDLRFAVKLSSIEGETVFQSTDQIFRNSENSGAGLYTTEVDIPNRLLNSKHYQISLWAGTPKVKRHIPEMLLFKLSVVGKVYNGSRLDDRQPWPGIVSPELKWKILKID